MKYINGQNSKFTVKVFSNIWFEIKMANFRKVTSAHR
jgi:hypothetical protein